MRKSILRLCALALFGVMSNMAFAGGGSVEASYLYQVNGDNTVKLVTVTNHEVATVATIPSNKITTLTANIQGGTAGKEYTVTEIGDEAFVSSSVLTTVNIPANVITIGSKAFNTPGKVTIYIDRDGKSDNDLTIKSDAFRNQLSKTPTSPKLYDDPFTPAGEESPITIGAYNKSKNNVVWFYKKDNTVLNSMDLRNSAKIEAGAFAYTTIASTVVLPDYETIPEGMFMGTTTSAEGGFCVKLPVGSKLKTVGKYAFAYSDVNSIGYTDPYGAANLLFLPAGFTTVEDYGFACCPLLDATKTVHSTGITERISKVGEYAFYGDCEFVSGDANFENGFEVTGFENIFATFDVLAYGEGSFGKCNLTAINLSQSTITEIPASAFADQTEQVTNLVLPNGCVSVGDYAFANDNIATLNFPATLAQIGTGAFACKDSQLETTLNLVGEYNDGEYASTYPKHLSSALLSIGANAFDNRRFGDIYTHGYITYNENKEPQYVFPHIGSHNVLGYNYIYLPAQADNTGAGLKAKMAQGGWTSLKYPTTTGSVTFAGVNYTLGTQDAETGMYPVTVEEGAFGTEDATIYAQFIGKEDANGYVPAFYFKEFGSFTTKTFSKNITFATGEVAPGQEYFKDPLASEKTVWCDNKLDKDCTPSTVLPVNTFKDFTELTGVTFKSGFTTIGESAFEGCTALASVSGEQLTEIGKSAFKGTGITSANFAKLSTVGESAFENCAALTSFVAADVTTIGKSAFKSSGITNVTFEKVTLVGDGAFSDCAKLASAVISATTIPTGAFQNSGTEVEAGLTVAANSAEEIKSNAFTGAKVVSFTGDKLATLDATAFAGCTDLASFDAKVLETIPENAFKGAGKELKINIPAVKTIGQAAFQNSGVVSINDDGDNVIEEIGNYAFDNSNIKNVNLPKISSLAGFAFSNCTNLETVKTGENLKWVTYYQFPNAGADTKFEVTLSGVESIGTNAFNGSKLTKITLPKLTTISDATPFKDCTKLLSFSADVLETIPEGAFSGVGASGFAVTTPALKTISENAFLNSTLATINAPAVTTINEAAFSGTSLTEVDFPAVTTLNTEAFKDCSILNKVTLGSAQLVENTFIGAGTGNGTPTNLEVTTAAAAIAANAFNGSHVVTVNANKVTSLDAAAFSGCTTLKTFNAPELETILAGTFQGTDETPNSIESVDLPKVTTIGADAFNTSNLKNLTAPSLVTIGSKAFRKTQLEEITFPSTLTSMGAAAFAISTLKKADFSSATALTEIPDRAFAYCASLMDVSLGNVTSVGPSAFFGTAIESITLPATLTTFGEDAFNAESLNSVYVSYTTVPALNTDPFTKEGDNYKPTLYVTGSRDAYRATAAGNWNKFIIGYNTIDIAVNGSPISSDVDGLYTLVDSKDVQNVVVSVTGDGAGKYVYKRTFNNTNWQAWFVPFDVEVTENDVVKFAYLYDTNVDAYNETTIEFMPVPARTTIKANVPYLVQVPSVDEYTFEFSTIKATDETTVATVSNVENKFHFKGTYNEITADKVNNTDWYALSGGSFMKAAVIDEKNPRLGAYRFYMTIESRTDNPYGTPAPATVKVVVLDEETTGISNINAGEIAEGAMFDLQGRKINAPVKGQVYIQNGVKKLAK